MSTSESVYVDGLLEPDLQIDRKCNVDRICEVLKQIRNNTKINGNGKEKNNRENGVEEKFNP